MAWLFTILILAWPAVEIAAFIEVARWIGLLGAVAGVILSGMIGTALLRIQGLSTARRAQAQLARGQMPVAELFDGACLAAAGLLLLLPGYATDLLAVPLLLPPVRLLLRRGLQSRFPPPDGPTVIEGDWEVVDEGRPPSGKPRLPH